MSSHPIRLRLLGVVVTVLLMVLGLGSCGEDDPTGQVRTAANGDRISEADVAFAQDLLEQHAESLLVVDLTLGRRLSPEIAELAESVRTSQTAEIQQLATWLAAWGEEVPVTERDHGADGHDDEHAAKPQGALGDARGAAFERAWVEAMADHHARVVEMASRHAGAGTFGPLTRMAQETAGRHRAELRRLSRG